MGIVIPSSKDVRKLIKEVGKLVDIETQRLEIEQYIAQLLGAKPRAYFEAIQTTNGFTFKGELKMAELREGQFIDLSVAVKTAAGHPAKFQAGSASFVTSGPEATVGPDPNDPTNELKARLTGVDGSANAAGLVTFKADGDPDDDASRDVVATLDYVVTQGEAVVAEITAGPATDLPPTP